MLKIKDNVDLKELEKYGFKYREDYFIKYLYSTKTIGVRVEPECAGEENKYFYVAINNYGEHTTLNDVLYYIVEYKKQLERDIEEIKELFNDLTKDGLVEKVGE